METGEIEVSHDSKKGEFETVALGWWVSGCGIKICRKLDLISPAASGKTCFKLLLLLSCTSDITGEC